MSARVIHDLPHDEYLAAAGLSSTGLRELLRSPAHFVASRTAPRKPTEALVLGTAIHLGVLEPDRFASEVVERPKFDRRTKIGKADAETWDATNAGRIGLDADALADVRACVESVHAHPAAARLLADGRPEVSVLWADEDSGVACKARLDWWRDDGVIVDLKTTDDASPTAFARTVARYGYHVQAAWYARAAAALGRPAPAFVFVAVEKTAPFAVGCYALDPEAMDAGRARVADALSTYEWCARASVWPAYSTLIESISLPAWAATA